MPKIERGERGKVRRLPLTDAEVTTQLDARRAASWASGPWIVGRLKRRGRAAAFAALGDFALWIFQRGRVLPTQPEIQRAADVFVERAKASRQLAVTIGSRAPLGAIGWFLQEIAFAEAMRLRAARLAAPAEAEFPKLRGVSNRTLANGLKSLHHAATLEPRAAEVLARRIRQIEGLITLRKVLAIERKRPARKPRHPEWRVATAVDATWAAPRKDRDEVAASFCREVLEINTSAKRIESMMKPHRRKTRTGI